MKKLFSCLSLALITGAAVYAAPLSPEAALQRLDGNDQIPLATRAVSSPMLKRILKSPEGQPALYVFDKTDNQGFLVVSADDCTPPLLGYSETGNFDIDNVPPALEYWLNEYQRQIEYMREQDNYSTRSEVSTRVSLPNWAPIAPKVKTLWNQDWPYNSLCPKYGNSYTPTGCVAVSMAQVMNYFEWPKKGKGSISYACSSLNKQLSLNFSSITFDWDNMLDSYTGSYNMDQQSAVATLMQACGYSVQMLYSPNASGAVSGYIPGSLMRYFDYDPSVVYVSRSMKTYTEWATLLYNNLKDIGPVIYDGDSASLGGHSFVCDGYSNNGYFHFNWGWGGMSDGYFLLDALDPPALGIGGGGGGFEFNQDMILNIQPNKGQGGKIKEEIVLSGSVEGYNNSANTFMYIKTYGDQFPGFRYYGDSEMSFSVGCIIEQADNPGAPPTYVKTSNNYNQWMPIDPGRVVYCIGGEYAYPNFIISNMKLSDNVKYKITLAYLPDGSSEWLPATAGVGCYNYFYVTKNGKDFTFENFPQMQFECSELKFNTELYNGVGANISLTIVNKNDSELTRGVTLRLLDKNDNVAYESESILLTLDPKETRKISDWTTTLNRLLTGNLTTATTFYPALFDIDTQTYYYKSTEGVRMNPNPGKATYSISLAVDDAQTVFDPGFNANVYQVPTSYSFGTTTTINVTKGIFANNLLLKVLAPQGQGNGGITFIEVMSYTLPLKIIDEGNSGSIPMIVTFPGATVGQIYMLGILVAGERDIVNSTMTFFTPLSNESGVESLGLSDGDLIFIQDKASSRLSVLGGEGGIASVDAYYMNGIKAPVRVNYNGDIVEVDMSALNKGVIIVNAVDKAGNRKTIKVAI